MHSKFWLYLIVLFFLPLRNFATDPNVSIEGQTKTPTEKMPESESETSINVYVSFISFDLLSLGLHSLKSYYLFFYSNYEVWIQKIPTPPPDFLSKFSKFSN